MPMPPNTITVDPPGFAYDYLTATPPVQVPDNAFAIWAEEGAAKALNAALCGLLDTPCQLTRSVLAQHKPALGALRDALSSCILSRKPQRAVVQ